jgi:ribosomal protein S18 acetylase RimI-like enzyme
MLVRASAVANVATALDETARRWRSADSLLPAPAAPTLGCAAALSIAGSDGQCLAAGSCEHWQVHADSFELTWGAACRFRLNPLVAGTSAGDVTAALEQLLLGWRQHLLSMPAAADDDTAAVVIWPSRDVGGPAALLRRGFAPIAVIAARRSDAGPVADVGERAGLAAPGVRVRRASAADIEDVVRLGLDVARFDGYFGAARNRPSTVSAMTREAAALLTGPRPWVWLAERDGASVGMLAAQQPAQADWIAPMTSVSQVAYLLLTAVDPAERGQGVGASLAAELNREVRAAGVGLTLLNYAQANPLSVPFWSQQGYRPLWTYWEARPAAAVR